jgi:hypothetical protein
MLMTMKILAIVQYQYMLLCDATIQKGSYELQVHIFKFGDYVCL